MLLLLVLVVFADKEKHDNKQPDDKQVKQKNKEKELGKAPKLGIANATKTTKGAKRLATIAAGKKIGAIFAGKNAATIAARKKVATIAAAKKEEVHKQKGKLGRNISSASRTPSPRSASGDPGKKQKNKKVDQLTPNATAAKILIPVHISKKSPKATPTAKKNQSKASKKQLGLSLATPLPKSGKRPKVNATKSSRQQPLAAKKVVATPTVAPTKSKHALQLDDDEEEVQPTKSKGRAATTIPATPTARFTPNVDTCSGPNTVRNLKGQCVCLRGYVGDQPLTSRGCWICRNGCHSDAVCAFPGKCKCSKGLVGDGVSACRIPRPVMVSVAPNKAPAHTIVTIGYTVTSEYDPRTGYCRFGSSVTTAQIAQKGVMTCEVPVDVYGFVKISVSFDSATWSQEIFNFEIQRNRISGISEAPIFTIGIVAVVIVLLIVFVVVVRGKKRVVGDSGDGLSLRVKEKMDGKRKGRSDARPRNRVVGP
jgi:hypothetical protein